jgi:menaquinone-dependent protoporphyrinogen IX oxidase
MIMGWHRAALRFLKKHREAFQNIPLAVFVMAMNLTQSGERLPTYNWVTT